MNFWRIVINLQLLAMCVYCIMDMVSDVNYDVSIIKHMCGFLVTCKLAERDGYGTD